MSLLAAVIPSIIRRAWPRRSMARDSQRGPPAVAIRAAYAQLEHVVRAAPKRAVSPSDSSAGHNRVRQLPRLGVGDQAAHEWAAGQLQRARGAPAVGKY
jgi:hypothetical protein